MMTRLCLMLILNFQSTKIRYLNLIKTDIFVISVVLLAGMRPIALLNPKSAIISPETPKIAKVRKGKKRVRNREKERGNDFRTI